MIRFSEAEWREKLAQLANPRNTRTVAHMLTEERLAAAQEREKRPKKAKRKAVPAVPESVVLKQVMNALALDRRVRWSRRMNSGAVPVDGKRFVRFGFAGCPDVMGQMADGRWLLIEVKAARGRLSVDQAQFLKLVASKHVVSGVVRSVGELQAILDA